MCKSLCGCPCSCALDGVGFEPPSLVGRRRGCERRRDFVPAATAGSACSWGAAVPGARGRTKEPCHFVAPLVVHHCGAPSVRHQCLAPSSLG